MTTFKKTHGGEVYSTAHKLGISPNDLIDFSSNANLFAYGITEALIKGTPYPFLHYPDSNAPGLTQKIALHESVSPNNILLGNGSADLIWHFFLHMQIKKVLFIGPIFSEFVAACQALHIAYDVLETSAHTGFAITHEHCLQIQSSDADLTLLCSPNNPGCITYPNITDVLLHVKTPYLFIDNSYREFLYETDYYTKNHYNYYRKIIDPKVSLFTLHSFTKFFCCPGIRLGYMLGDASFVDTLQSKRPAWMVPAFSQTIGEKMLFFLDRYRNTLPHVQKATTATANALHQVTIVDPRSILEGPGFLLFTFAQEIPSAHVTVELLQHKLLVRNCDQIPGMPPGFIRVQARPLDDLNKLTLALASIGKQL